MWYVPGCTCARWMPDSASSGRTVSANDASAALLAQYAGMLGRGNCNRCRGPSAGFRLDGGNQTNVLDERSIEDGWQGLRTGYW